MNLKWIPVLLLSAIAWGSFALSPTSAWANSIDQLCAAAARGDTDTVRVLIQGGVDIDAKDKVGRTALMHAARYGENATIDALLELGANINAKNLNGHTALIYAARFGNADTVKLLLEKGADFQIATAAGATALELAKSYSHTNVVSILQNTALVDSRRTNQDWITSVPH